MAESMDQVLQNGQSYQETINGTLNQYEPVSPRRFRSMSFHKNGQHDTGLQRSKSKSGPRERYGSPPLSLDREGGADGRTATMRSRETSRSGSSGGYGTATPAGARNTSAGTSIGSEVHITDFFSPDVFQIVLRNPTTSHQFLKFCQSRSCGENMEFLEKACGFNFVCTEFLLGEVACQIWISHERKANWSDQAAQLLSSIHSTYATVNAPRQINIPSHISRQLSHDIKTSSNRTFPALESIFEGAQDHIEKLIASDIYPRFVKHQITTSAALALAKDRERFHGLGDCFCLTDPAIADNPILYASNGFVAVTGYSRKDIIPRNCRFLQGSMTDPRSPKRLTQAIKNGDEIVELILNYRKNGDPFWNLLYVAPLYDEHGTIKFFLGGQINVSTTVHSCTDVLRVLGQNIEEDDDRELVRSAHGRPRKSSLIEKPKSKNSFFKSWRTHRAPALSSREDLGVRDEVGIGGALLNRVGKMDIQTQLEAFYTTYSKYLILKYNTAPNMTSCTLKVSHYSPGVVDMLCLNLPNGSIAPIFHQDIFGVLASHGTISKAFKPTVLDNLRARRAISLDIGLMTGYEEKKGRFFGSSGAERSYRRVEEPYIAHWTPLMNDEEKVGWVVLMISPR
ncbi:hypothetical protein BP5796_01306 [Coleophoma crateriformis]|uniref:RGS domain-containing protein n=1 Tax=Coleophoma crateriformis TaxID=565419 RepID=A0A3D8T020_9HELO|nr:hypothetical protein BP5796_01306 [Coleophoma crateriformis]